MTVFFNYNFTSRLIADFIIFAAIMPAEIYIDPVVVAVNELHKEVIATKNDIGNVADWLMLVSTNLHQQHQNGNTACAVELSNYLPGLLGKSEEEIMNYALREDEAELTIALAYGFTNLRSIDPELSFDVNFELAVDHMLNGEIESVQSLVRENPKLVEARSPFGHNATLLHYASSNGVEVWRQKVPMNLPDIVSFLIQSGADRMATANIYNGQYTTAELAGTSGHPLAYQCVN